MKLQFLAKMGILLKYCLPTNIGGQWTAQFALALFIGSYIWRNYYGGQHDAVFFEVLSLGGLWYVYCAGIIKTLCGLRVNSNSFLIDDLKKASYCIGLLASVLIYGASFLFFKQFGFSGCIAFASIVPAFLLLNRRWHKWIDVTRLNIAGLLPFLLINAYLMMAKVFPVSIGWLIGISLISVFFLLAIFYSQYKSWMNNPRNLTFLDVDYRYVNKYYRSNRGFD